MKIIPMTEKELKDGGKSLQIDYGFGKSPFGDLIIASTSRGITYIAFLDGVDNDRNRQGAIKLLQKFFPKSILRQGKVKQEVIINKILKNIGKNKAKAPNIFFHLKGTPFQIKVWQALLKIPTGQVRAYKEVAKSIGNPGAVRAVANAVGKNPIAILIPCHRVIRSGGDIGKYHWGRERKKKLLASENVNI